MDKKREKIDFLYILASALNLYFQVYFFGQNSLFLRLTVLVLLVFIVKGCLSEAPLLKLLAFCQYWILANLSLSPKIVGAQKFSKFLTRNHKLPPQELVNPPGHQLGWQLKLFYQHLKDKKISEKRLVFFYKKASAQFPTGIFSFGASG